jgi:hypothetical protein
MEGSSDRVRTILARLVGAEALRRRTLSDNADGFGVSEVTGAGMRMMAAGRSMGQIQRVSRDVSAYAGDQIDAARVAVIPSLLRVV